MSHLKHARSVAVAIKPAPPQPEIEPSCLEVYEREIDYLYATLQRLGVRSPDSEDLAQEVFLVLHRNWRDLDVTRPFRPYLFAIAFRLVCAHRRRRGRETPYEHVDAEDRAIGPEETFQSKESTQLLMAALETVPLSRRAVVVMHDLDGFPIVEIAARLSLSRFGAYGRLRKGRRELASALRRLLRSGGNPRAA